MNTQSASPAKAESILVWDAPVRVIHWLLVLCFSGAYLTAESESWRLLHVTLGYSMAALVVVRILWGLVGTRYARFVQFVRGPRAALRYLRSLMGNQPEHHTGHNPAGALAIVALLGLTLAIGASGWAVYNDVGGDVWEEVHEALANGMLGLVLLHVAAVLASSRLHRDNLVRAMVTGRKQGKAADGIGRSWWPLAVLILAGVLSFGWVQWHSAPAAGAEPAARIHHDDD